MFIAAPGIALFYEVPKLTLYVRVMSFQFIFQGIQSIPFAYVSKHMLFRKNYVATFCGVVVSAVIAITLAVSGLGVWALIGMTSIEVIVATIILWISLKFKIAFVFDKTIFKQMLRYCWKLVAVDLLNALYSSLNSIIIGKKFTKSDVAYYNKAYNLPQTMFGSVNTAISKVLFPVFAEKEIDDFERLSMLRRSIRTINYVMFPMLAGLAAIAPTFVVVLFTDKWSAMTIYLQIMCVVWMFQPVQTCAIQMFKAVGKNDVYLKLEIIKKILAIAILISFIVIFNSAIGIAWALLTGQILSALMNVPIMKKHLGYRYRHQLKDMCSSVLLCIVMVVLTCAVGMLVQNLIVTLIVQVLVGVGTYVVLSLVSKNENFMYVYKTLTSSLLKRN